MNHTARGTFQIRMKPAEASSAQLGRMTFDKTWEGDLRGESLGEMLSVGDPQSGTAAYTVLEVVQGELNGRKGGFAFHQYGTLVKGAQTLLYEIVPASGSGELTGISGKLQLDMVDKVHHYTLTYALPPEGR